MKHKKKQERLEVRQKDWQKTIQILDDKRAKGYHKPGSINK